MSITVTKLQVEAAIRTIAAVAECIRDLGEVPAGHLYAQLMGHVTLDQFEVVIAKLIQAKLVSRAPSHMLTWIGPKGDPTTAK